MASALFIFYFLTSILVFYATTFLQTRLDFILLPPSGWEYHIWITFLTF